MNEEKSNLDSDVILAYLKLSRAMRRCPPERKYLPFPPAVGRLLECAAANPASPPGSFVKPWTFTLPP